MTSQSATSTAVQGVVQNTNSDQIFMRILIKIYLEFQKLLAKGMMEFGTGGG